MNIYETYKKNTSIDNRIFLIIVYILNLIIQSLVPVSGDDYMYGTFAKQGILKSVFSYYNTGNGRWLINIIDSFILRYDRYLFIIINPLMICLVILLISKIATKLGNKNCDLLKISALLFSSLNILMTRESLYWITGSMNYLYPGCLFLLAYYLFLDIKEGEKRHLNIFPLVTFLAGASMEQFGLMLVGILTIEYLYKIIKHEKIDKMEVIAYITGVIGLFTVVLGPGNYVRVGVAAQEKNSLLIGIIDLIYNNFNSKVANIYILIISIYIYIYIKNLYPNFKKNKYVSLANILINLISIIFSKTILLLCSLIIFSYLILFICYIYLKYNKNISLVLLLISGVGSQIMLLISVIWGFRISFSMYIVWFILILYLASYFYDLAFQIAILVCLCSINIILGILGCLIAIILKYFNKSINSNVICGLALILIMFNLGSNVNGYYKNFVIQEQNIERLKSKKSEISLKKLDNDIYGWTFAPLSEFHENYMKQYYGLSDKTKIIYEDN